MPSPTVRTRSCSDQVVIITLVVIHHAVSCKYWVDVDRDVQLLCLLKDCPEAFIIVELPVDMIVHQCTKEA